MLKLDKEASKIEIWQGSDVLYDKRRDALVQSLDEANSERKFKIPRLGVEDCYGRGCNGHLIFWQDPAYKKARELMAEKKPGEMLTKNPKGKNLAKATRIIAQKALL